eukprot:78017-Rhodomonas_salina.9
MQDETRQSLCDLDEQCVLLSLIRGAARADRQDSSTCCRAWYSTILGTTTIPWTLDTMTCRATPRQCVGMKIRFGECSTNLEFTVERRDVDLNKVCDHEVSKRICAHRMRECRASRSKSVGR